VSVIELLPICLVIALIAKELPIFVLQLLAMGIIGGLAFICLFSTIPFGQQAGDPE
jgi:hypothetical protein